MRRTIVNPGGKRRTVKASTNMSSARRLMQTLKEAYNILDAMDVETWEAVDGEAMQDDLDVYIREVQSAIRGE